MVFYEKPIYRPLGDLYLCVEFGDELSLELNLRVIALDRLLKREPIEGIRETIPTNRSLGIVYDPFVISYNQLVAKLRELESLATEIDELESRLFTIPVWYNDPWSQECAKAHGFPNNLEFIAEVNGLSVDDVIKAHSGTDWWVTAVGFQPATYQALPLDPNFSISAPKYPRPRKWTPERILCQAGKITSFYPVPSPGGYQLLGRTPIELYDPKQRHPVFRDNPVLPRVSDRHRYVPIDEAMYWQIRDQMEAGIYEYDIKVEIVRVRDLLSKSLDTKGAP